MLLRRTILMLSFVILAHGASQAQEKDAKVAKEPKDVPVKEATGPSMLAIHMHNGTVLQNATLEGSIEIMTRYGKFVIPASDIRRIDFGFRILDDDAQKLKAALEALSNDNFQKRETAAQELISLGRSAYPALQKAAKGRDLDMTQRIDKIMKEISRKVPSDQLKFADEDVIHTAAATLRGKITVETLKVRAAVLGELPLPLAHLRQVRAATERRVVRIEPDGKQPWVETEVELPANSRFSIKASGSIEININGRGGSAGPQGSRELAQIVNSNVGHSVSTPVGLLQARIKGASKSTEFTPGDRHEGTTVEGGKLSFRIYTGGPHEFPLSGGYHIEVEIE